MIFSRQIKMLSMAVVLSVPASAYDLPALSISSLDTRRVAQNMQLDFKIDPTGIHLPASEEMTVIPVIWSADSASRLEFSPVVIAGHNRWFARMRRGDEIPSMIQAGKGSPVSIHLTLPYEEWMERSGIDIDVVTSGCCGVPKESKIYHIADFDYTPDVFEPVFSYIPPKAETSKIREISGSAYIDFPVNKTVIYPGYRRNPQELLKIISSIDTIKNDPDCKVSALSFKGYASPEGSWSNNERLARGRTAALRDYVNTLYHFPQSIITTSYEPEDWSGLRKYVASSGLADRCAILALIDSDLSPDAKDRRIKRDFPSQYAFLLQEVYPALRHSDYKVEYEVRSFSNPEEIKNVMAVSPQKLSLNEFYIAANSCEEGSDEYNEIFETAVRMYPDDVVANLNAANSSMARGDYKRAEAYLGKAGESPEVEYARGVLYGMQGEYDRAEKILMSVYDKGYLPAAKALEEIRHLRDKKEVRYVDN